MPKDDDLVSLYADVPSALKLALERIAFERTQAGRRTTLRQVVIEALEAFVGPKERSPEPPKEPAAPPRATLPVEDLHEMRRLMGGKLPGEPEDEAHG
jgi:hypothetical protein